MFARGGHRQVVTKLEEDDRLVPVMEETLEEIDAAVAKVSDLYSDTGSEASSTARRTRSAAAQDLLRKAGYQP